MINNERLFHNLQRLVAMYRISCETKMLILNTRESVNETLDLLKICWSQAELGNSNCNAVCTSA